MALWFVGGVGNNFKVEGPFPATPIITTSTVRKSGGGVVLEAYKKHCPPPPPSPWFYTIDDYRGWQQSSKNLNINFHACAKFLIQIHCACVKIDVQIFLQDC